MSLTPQQTEAIRLLGVYTRGRFDVWTLAGGFHKRQRAQLMSLLTGRTIPQSQAGINALTAALYTVGGITGECPAHREQNFREWAQSLYPIPNGGNGVVGILPAFYRELAALPVSTIESLRGR